MNWFPAVHQFLYPFQSNTSTIFFFYSQRKKEIPAKSNKGVDFKSAPKKNKKKKDLLVAEEFEVSAVDCFSSLDLVADLRGYRSLDFPGNQIFISTHDTERN